MEQPPVDSQHIAANAERFSHPKDGGCAFPTPDAEPGFRCSEKGMSLRDYFAASAMQGVIHHSIKIFGVKAPKKAADIAYQVADAMIDERAKDL